MGAILSYTAVVRPSPLSDDREMTIEEVLSYPILLSSQISESIKNPYCFKIQCSELGKKVELTCHIIRSVARLVASRPPSYERPLRCVVTPIFQLFERSLRLAEFCRRRSIFFVVSGETFRRVFFLLDASVHDMNWLRDTLDPAVTCTYVPTIFCTEPIIPTIWSSISSLHDGQLQDKIAAARELDSIARSCQRYSRLVVKEGGVPPLVKLLNDPSSSSQAQKAAAATLSALADINYQAVVVQDDCRIWGCPALRDAAEKGLVLICYPLFMHTSLKLAEVMETFNTPGVDKTCIQIYCRKGSFQRP